jgi:hypothetical protein
MKSAFVNLYQASVENESSAVIGGKDCKTQLIMGVPIYHGWYDRAEVGMHHRMGDTVVQDYGLSKQTIVALHGRQGGAGLRFVKTGGSGAPARTQTIHSASVELVQITTLPQTLYSVLIHV